MSHFGKEFCDTDATADRAFETNEIKKEEVAEELNVAASATENIKPEMTLEQKAAAAESSKDLFRRTFLDELKPGEVTSVPKNLKVSKSNRVIDPTGEKMQLFVSKTAEGKFMAGTTEEEAKAGTSNMEVMELYGQGGRKDWVVVIYPQAEKPGDAKAAKASTNESGSASEAAKKNAKKKGLLGAVMSLWQ